MKNIMKQIFATLVVVVLVAVLILWLLNGGLSLLSEYGSWQTEYKEENIVRIVYNPQGELSLFIKKDGEIGVLRLSFGDDKKISIIEDLPKSKMMYAEIYGTKGRNENLLYYRYEESIKIHVHSLSDIKVGKISFKKNSKSLPKKRRWFIRRLFSIKYI